MIDYVFALVVGLLAAAAAGYAYRAAKSAEELLKKIREWEAAWVAYYYNGHESVQQTPQQREISISREEPEVEILPDEPKSQRAEAPAGEDYVAQLMRKVACAGEVMKSMGGCAPVDEVINKCGIPKHQLRALFNLKDAKNEVCLRTA